MDGMTELTTEWRSYQLSVDGWRNGVPERRRQGGKYFCEVGVERKDGVTEHVTEWWKDGEGDGMTDGMTEQMIISWRNGATEYQSAVDEVVSTFVW